MTLNNMKKNVILLCFFLFLSDISYGASTLMIPLKKLSWNEPIIVNSSNLCARVFNYQKKLLDVLFPHTRE